MKRMPSWSTTNRRQAFRISALGNIVTPSHNIGCISNFLWCCEKIWPRQLIQERAFESYDSRGKEFVVAGRNGSKQQARRKDWEAESSRLQAQAGSRESRVEARQGYTRSKPAPSNVLPLERPHLLNLKRHHQLGTSSSNIWACGAFSFQCPRGQACFSILV